MICDIKTSPIHPYMEYLRIFVAHISKLAVSLKTDTKNYDRQRIFKTIKNTDKRQSA